VRTAIVVGLVIVVALVLLGFGLQFGGFFNKVTLKGTADPNNIDATSTQYIQFSDAHGHTYSAKVSNGNYTIMIPNNDSYNVFIGYTSSLIGSTTCDAGIFHVQPVTGMIHVDFVCGVVNISG
jgi:hypothetical protein